MGAMAKVAVDLAGGGERRVSRRDTLGRTGTLRIGDAAPLEVAIADLTREGCRIETDAVLLPDTEVLVGLAHVGLTPGRIVWRGAAGYGCRFDVPLAPGDVTAAHRASNIAAMPLADARAAGKDVRWLGPRERIALWAALSAAGWGGIALVGWFALS